MARVKRALNARKNHKKVLKLAKGYYGGKSKLFKTANESVISLKLANVDMNRKMLSEIAINDPKAFAELVEIAKKQIEA